MAQSELAAGAATSGELPTEVAFRATLQEMAALGEAAVLPINVDVVSAVTTVLGCLPELRALRGEIARQLPSFNLERFDKLEQYTLALNQANAIHRGAQAQRTSLAELGGAVADLRDRLLGDAQSLAHHGLMNGERLKECKRLPGYRAVATDVFTLVALFKEHWPRIENRTPVTNALLQQAGNRALELLGAVGVKEQAQVTQGEAQLARQQAFTLFFKAYDDARRAVEYLRHEQGDADEIAPALYAGRPPRSRTPAEPAGAPEAATKDAPESKGAPAPASDDDAAPKINNPHNLPIDSPFVA